MGIGARTVFPNEWSRSIIGTSVRYKQPKLIFNKLYYKEELILESSATSQQTKVFLTGLKFDHFKDTSYIGPTARGLCQHYVSLEERFDIEVPKWINTFGLRVRYRAKLILKFKGDWLSYNDGLYLPMSMELFWNLKGAQQFNDVLRITSGIGYEFSSTWKAEFNVSYHYTRNTVEDNFSTNDFVFGFKVFHRFVREKNRTKGRVL